MTHLSSADEIGGEATSRQIERFVRLPASLMVQSASETVLAHGLARHLGGAAEEASREHWIRPGIALFGISPFADKPAVDFGMSP